MAIKLYRCSAEWVKIGGHPCWRVEKALIDAGIEYERVPGPALPWQRNQRTAIIEKSGQTRFPVIEFEDGSIYREESKQMEATIRAGKLFQKGGAAQPAAAEPAREAPPSEAVAPEPEPSPEPSEPETPEPPQPEPPAE